MLTFKVGMLIMLGVVTICYSGTGIIQILRTEYSAGFMWLSYAVANSCLMRMTYAS